MTYPDTHCAKRSYDHRDRVLRRLFTAGWLPRAPELDLRRPGGKAGPHARRRPSIHSYSSMDVIRPMRTSRRRGPGDRGLGLTGRERTRGDATGTGGLAMERPQ